MTNSIYLLVFLRSWSMNVLNGSIHLVKCGGLSRQGRSCSSLPEGVCRGILRFTSVEEIYGEGHGEGHGEGYGD